MMSSWQECKLGDIINFGNGKSRPKIEGQYPIYGGNGVLGYANQFNYEDETIILGRVGAYCGSVYYEKKPIWISDNALSAKPKKGNHTKFLYYFLKNMDLNSHAGGSSHPLITQSLLNSLDIEICSEYEEQKAIAEVLSSLDDKIDLLHRQNKTLEDLAQTLFRQWFIEEAKEEWEEKPLSEIALHVKNNIKPSSFENKSFYHFSLPAFDNGQRATKELGSEILSNKYQVIKHSILVSKLNPRTPRIWLIDENIDEDNSICSTEFQVLYPKEENWRGFIYCYLKTEQAVQELAGASSGTSGSHQRVKPEDIFNLTFQYPDIDTLKRFDVQSSDYWRKIKVNQKQIQTLENLRDTLLPKLLSGEVRVKNE